jgi:hypothetical protein
MHKEHKNKFTDVFMNYTCSSLIFNLKDSILLFFAFDQVIEK